MLVNPDQSNPGDLITAAAINTPVNQIAEVVNGNIEAANLASNAVSTDKLASSSVTTAKIADLNVTSGKLAADSVTATKIDWASTGADGGIWWEELGRTTLGSVGDTITVSGLPARKYLKILCYVATSGQVDANMRFNNDSGSNYAYIVGTGNGNADGSATSVSFLSLANNTTTVSFSTVEVLNIATAPKLAWGDCVDAGTSGAANAPNRRLLNGKWHNTSDSITRVDVVNADTGDFAAGSEVVVLGHN